jgi:hypothetical protein
MRSFLFSVLLALMFVVGSMSSSTVFAQDGAGITMRPATIEEQIDPGQTKTFSVTIRNESDTDQVYYLGRRDIVGVRDGSVPVYADEDIAPTAMDMSQWILLSTDSISVPARGETPIQFSVTAPQNAAPGSHFAGIFISVEPPKLRESGAAIGYEVANIITMRVAGEVNESATIRQFSTDNYLYGSPRVSFNVKIENDGNTLVRPTGPLQITNMFGKEVSGGLIFNEAAAAVFPGDTREYVFEWLGEGYGFGRYEAIVSPVYGEEGSKQTISSTVIFWILPMKIVGPALGVLLVLLLIAVVGVKLYVRRKLSYYNALGGRRLGRRQDSGNPILLIFLVMMTVTALFFIILLVLFS